MASILEWLLCLVAMSAIQGCSSQDAAGFKLTMSPEHYLQFDADETPTFNVECNLRDSDGQPVPLAGCGFQDYCQKFNMQFNEGSASPNYTHITEWGDPMTDAKYKGRGLEHGDCGVTFERYTNNNFFILGCRVRPLTGAWQTAVVLLFITPLTTMQYHLEPPVLRLALAGSHVTVKGKAEQVLDSCWFTLPSPACITVRVDPPLGNHSLASYHGAGLDNKECGTTIHNVQPERSGFVQGWAIGSTPPYGWSCDFIELIVMSAPDDVGMTKTTNRDGGILSATCWSKNSRPVANITWLLDDKVLRQDKTNDAPVETEWLWNHDPHNITQHLLLHVTREDNGKTLVCRVGHMALPSGVVELRKTVNVSAKLLDFKTHFIIAVVICGLLVVGLLWFYKQLCWSANGIRDIPIEQAYEVNDEDPNNPTTTPEVSNSGSQASGGISSPENCIEGYVLVGNNKCVQVVAVEGLTLNDVRSRPTNDNDY